MAKQKVVPLHKMTDEELDVVATNLVKSVKADWRKERRDNPYTVNPELLEMKGDVN